MAVRLPTFTAGLTPAPRGQLRQLRAHGAVVLNRLARVDAALELRPVPSRALTLSSIAVVALILLAEIARQCDVVARLAELARDDVVQSVDGVAAAAGQPRIGRRRDAERREVAGPTSRLSVTVKLFSQRRK